MMVLRSDAFLIEDLSNIQLLNQYRNSIFPKWRTLCLLKYLGFPALYSGFIHPSSTPQYIDSLISEFATRRQLNNILIRTDNPRESRNYPRGGNSFLLKRSIQIAIDAVRSGRAVIFTEPTNRFTNKLSVNSTLDINGVLVIEVLGPGYDVSDLQRADVLPHVIIELKGIDWQHHARPWPFDLRVRLLSSREEERRRARLKKIGRYVLPNIGVSVVGDEENSAKSWLNSHGYNYLWENWSIDSSVYFSRIREWYDAAFIIGNFLLVERQKTLWNCINVAASDLGDGRFIYWDIVDSETKFLLAQSKKTRR